MMGRTKNRTIAKNTISLMIFNIAKIVFPFITLPYLTRVFTTETYGSVAYVKTVMSYLQIFVDFGFMLSATKDIAKAKSDKQKTGSILYNTMTARFLLGIIGFILTTFLSFLIPVLRENFLYTTLSYVSVFLSIFLMDFLFRGLEIMYFITVRFVLMKIISLILTFLFVKNDSNVLFIPIFDILSSMVAVVLVFMKIKKLEIPYRKPNIKEILATVKDSSVYFMSNVATTSFNAIGTLIIGFTMSLTDVAIWSVCMQVLGSIQACYTPISDGIYPEMIKNKDLKLFKKIVRIFTPLMVIGCVILFLATPLIFEILGGGDYLSASSPFRILIGAVFFGFFAILYGWPVLGPIEKQKQVTVSTWVAAILYFAMIGILILTCNFNLTTLALVRVAAEILLFTMRYSCYIKYKKLYYSSRRER